jgi:hypothetical protein
MLVYCVLSDAIRDGSSSSSLLLKIKDVLADDMLKG